MSGSRSARAQRAGRLDLPHRSRFSDAIGKNCTVGHNVILHGCTIEEGALVGMGSIVMNGARIGRNSIVGAGSVITEGKEFPEQSLIIGSPARVIRTLDDAQVQKMGSSTKSTSPTARASRRASSGSGELSFLGTRALLLRLRPSRAPRTIGILVATVLVRIGFRRKSFMRRAFAFCKSIAIVHRDCAFLFQSRSACA